MPEAHLLPQEPAAPPASYAAQRLASAGIPRDLCLFYAPHPRVPDQTRQLFSVFDSDDDDNLVITYPTLSGEVETYDNGSKNNPTSIFERKRLKLPRDYTDKEGKPQTQKYSQPPGTRQLPFFMPAVVAKFQAKTKIETLYLVEGEIKAAAGVARGLDVVGLPSNQVPRQQINGHYHLDAAIVGLIKTCEVETLVLLHDADARTVHWEREKDLAKRPSSFATAVVNFRECIQELMDDKYLKRAYYLHGKRELCEKNAKGLDDMFAAFPDEQDAILAALAKGVEDNKYFDGLNATMANYGKIREYFGVNKQVKGPEQDFYKLYKKDIGRREFVFFGRCYFPDGDNDNVSYQRHVETLNYMRVEADWYKRVFRSVSAEEMVEEVVPWKVGEIARDYKNFPFFLEECEKFDGFTVMPDWNGHYQRVIGRNLNLVTPLVHEAKAGAITNTLAFLKHIFGGVATVDEGQLSDPFTVALDWLTIAHNEPTHQLPVIILVSKENKTGKTTFLNWMKWIYGSNAVILDNQRFGMNFNSHYASKFFIGLDEAFQDLEKKQEKERLKQMVTGKEMMIERKGVDIKTVPFYGKIVMTSNDAEKVMKLDDGETRWFVIRVPQLADEDPDMERKMKAEIPAWLHFLKHRKPYHERKSRLWFKPEWFITEQFRIIVEATKNRLDRTVEEFIKEMFLTYKLDKLRLSVKWLAKQINDTSKYRIDETDLRTYLKDRRSMEPSITPQRIKIPVALDEERTDNQGRPEISGYHTEVARYYSFFAKDWLNEHELEQQGKPMVRDEDDDPPIPF